MPRPTELPDAPFIAWMNLDTRNPEVAARVGHPANNVWLFKGIQYDGDYLLSIIPSTVAALDFVRPEPTNAELLSAYDGKPHAHDALVNPHHMHAVRRVYDLGRKQ